MLRVNQVKIKIEHSEEELKKKTAELLRVPAQEIIALTIVRQSIDARKKPDLFYSYTVDIKVKDEKTILKRFRGKENIVCKQTVDTYHFPESGKQLQKNPTVVVGMGPAGLFCSYFLCKHGYQVLLLERGKTVDERIKDVETFWTTGTLNPNSNVQFGEGGAGTFSDGKLNTLVKDKGGRNTIVLDTFVQFGAHEKIKYEAKPHIGTDVLMNVVRNMRNEILSLGGVIRFESQVTDILLNENKVAGVVINGQETICCEQVVLAIGHSARDTFSMLYKKNIPMEQKAFAVGLRVEHPQEMINKCQYGVEYPVSLGAAPYKLTAKAQNGRAVYSFCMCPGGYVVNASSEEGNTAVNGMSYSGRNGNNANSAIIVAVTPQDFGSEHPLAGIEFQRSLERKAYELGKGKIPVQRYGDFKARVLDKLGENHESIHQEDLCISDNMEQIKNDSVKVSGEEFLPQNKGEYVWANVDDILPLACNEAFLDGMKAFNRQIEGFDRPDAILSGVESRTSSPIRIVRAEESLQSSVLGLYPCGEGAGYAGGITSAAMDGIRIAEQIAMEFMPSRLT